MTVQSQTSRADYTGNGTTTNFAVPFYFLVNTDLLVIRTDDSTLPATVVTLALGTDYTVIGAGVEAGGTLTTTAAPTSSQRLSILRNIPFTQLTHYVPNDPFPAASHERALDKLTMEVQQLNEATSRALTLPQNTTGVSTQLPAPAANQLIGWDGTGTALANVDPATLATIVAFGTWRADQFTGNGVQTAFVLTDSPGVLANLDVSIAGVTQRPGVDYSWTSGTTLTTTVPVPNGQTLLARYGNALPTQDSVLRLDLADATNAASGDALVAVKQPFTGAVARTQHTKNSDVINAKDFGVVGDGVTDDTVAMQAFLTAITGKRGELPNGTYLCGPLIIYSGTYLQGQGTIKAKASLGNAEYLLRNPTPGTYTEQNIAIEGITFDGNNVGAGGVQARFAELVSFTRVTTLKLKNITVQNVQYIGTALGSCRKVVVEGSTFTGCGYSGTTSNGGSAVWCASASPDIPEDYIFTANTFHTNRWHGMHLSVRRAVVEGNVFLNNQEAHIFQARLLPNSDATDCVIADNVFDGVTKRDISAHAIESGCHRLTISGNTIRNCDHGGIALTDVRGATVTGNTISNFNTLAVAQSGIDILSNSILGAQPEFITIADNTIFDTRGPVLGYAAIGITKFGPGVAVRSVTIANNNCSGTAWTSGVPIKIGSATTGTGCLIRWNNGSADSDPVIGNFITNPGTGAQSVTGIGFKPRCIELLATSTNVAKIGQCNSIVGADGIAVYHSIASSTANSYGYSSAGRSVACLLVFDQAGTTQVAANFTSFNDDGFTINLTNTTAQAYVRYVAYP